MKKPPKKPGKKPATKPDRKKSKQRSLGQKTSGPKSTEQKCTEQKSGGAAPAPSTFEPLRVADAHLGFDRWARMYEGIMGTPPLSATRARAAALNWDAAFFDNGATLALLSLPVFALILGLGVTHTLKNRRVVASNAVPTLVVRSQTSAVSLRPSAPRAASLAQAGSHEVPAVIPQVISATVGPQLVNQRTAELTPSSLPADVTTRLPVGVSSPRLPSLASLPAFTLEQHTPLVVTEPRVAVLVPHEATAEQGLTLPPDVIARDAPLDVGGQDIARISCLAPASFRPAPPSLPRSGSLTPAAFGLALAASARAQTQEFVIYNDTYRSLAYPNGDVQPLYGVCTDVIIRAYRGVGIDLQQLVHDSRIGNGDVSIDHRRTETLRRFFARFGEQLAVTTLAEDYQPGDVVTYDRPQNRHSRAHIAMVSDVVALSGRYMILHNRGWGPQLEDGLFVDEMTGHYRYRGAPDAPLMALAAATLPAKLPSANQTRLPISRQAATATRPTVLARLAHARLTAREARGNVDGSVAKGLGH